MPSSRRTGQPFGEVHEGAEAIGVEDLVGHLQTSSPSPPRWRGTPLRRRTRSYIRMLLLMVDIQPAALAPRAIARDRCSACFSVTTPSCFSRASRSSFITSRSARANVLTPVGTHGELAGVGVGEIAALDVVATPWRSRMLRLSRVFGAGPAEVVGQQHQRRLAGRPSVPWPPIMHRVDSGPLRAAPRVPRWRRPLTPRGLRLPLRQVLLRQPLHLPAGMGPTERRRAGRWWYWRSMNRSTSRARSATRTSRRGCCGAGRGRKQHLLELVEDGVAGVVPPGVVSSMMTSRSLAISRSGKVEWKAMSAINSTAPEVLRQVGRGDPCLLLGGVGVELGLDAVEPVWMEGASLRRPLKSECSMKCAIRSSSRSSRDPLQSADRSARYCAHPRGAHTGCRRHRPRSEGGVGRHGLKVRLGWGMKKGSLGRLPFRMDSTGGRRSRQLSEAAASE